MEQLTISLPPDIAEKLQIAAKNSGIAPEDFLLISLQEKLSKVDPEFVQAMEHVFKKNAKLYKRLA